MSGDSSCQIRIGHILRKGKGDFVKQEEIKEEIVWDPTTLPSIGNKRARGKLSFHQFISPFLSDCLQKSVVAYSRFQLNILIAIPMIYQQYRFNLLRSTDNKIQVTSRIGKVKVAKVYFLGEMALFMFSTTKSQFLRSKGNPSTIYTYLAL